MSSGLVRTFTVGTASDCDMVIDDQYASNHHARVSLYADGTVLVEDLGSTNGTYVVPQGARVPVLHGHAGTRVTGMVRLHRGDALRVGRTYIPWGAE